VRPTVSAETTAPCFVVVVVAAAVVAVVVAAAATAGVDNDNAGDNDNNDNDQIPSYVLPTWLLKSLQSSALVNVLPL